MVYKRPYGAGSINASENGVEAVVQFGICEWVSTLATTV